MPAGYVQHAISGNFSAEAFLSCIARTHDSVFWLDDSLNETVSYLGWGTPIADASLRTVDSSSALPVSLVGWIGYTQRHDTLRPGDKESVSASANTQFMRVTVAIRVDHVTGHVAVIAEQWNDETTAIRAEILDIVDRCTPDARTPTEPPAASHTAAFWRDTTDHYASMIEQCRRHIRDGDAYQLCLTTSASVNTSDEPVDIYRRLRRLAPTRSGGFIRINGTSLLSASP